MSADEEQLQLNAIVSHKKNGEVGSGSTARCFMVAESQDIPQDANFCEKLKDQFKCPPHGYVEYFLRLLLTVFLIWATPWAIVGDYVMPGTNGFGIIITLILSLGAGIAITKVPMPLKLPPLPSLMGNLLMGFLLCNLPAPFNFTDHVDVEWSIAIRKIALTVILIRAGVGLDAEALKRMKCVVFGLSFIPCVTEACVDAVAAHFILGFPMEWGFMLGFVIAAISPAVVVPSMVSLGDRGYGNQAGIPSLMIAAASIDDILAISIFHVILGLTEMGETSKHSALEMNSTDLLTTTEFMAYNVTGNHLNETHQESNKFHNLAWEIAKGPVELIVGVVGGILLGVMLWYIPNKFKRSSKSRGRLESGIIRDRTLLVFTMSLLFMFGSKRFEIVGAGPVACLVMGFVASLGWGKDGTTPVKVAMARIWFYGQPLLFGLIGAQMKLSAIDSQYVGRGLAVLGIGLVFRTVAAFLATVTQGMTRKEALFIGFGWLPKATVQAAIGSVALDHAEELGASEISKSRGKLIVTMAALSIIITAPLGAVLIGILGPKWLRRDRSREKSVVGW